MINKRNFINHATLIDSESDRSLPMISTPQPYPISNTSFYRSPLRDRQNKMNLSNTPLRSGKQSLSPLRLRKVDNNNPVNNSIRATKRKPIIEEQQDDDQNPCFNHQQKIAKFFVETHDQIMYYCEKCAILLASQGFPVKKIESQGVQQLSTSSFRRQNNARKQQIEQFMSNLEIIEKQLKSVSSNIHQNFSASQAQFQQQMSRIEEYYEQFYEILNLHKQRVFMEMKEEYQKINSQVFEMKKEIKEAVDETESMKKDILESWDDIIFMAQQHQYRPVINAYVQKLQTYQSISVKGKSLPELRVRRLNFVNTDEACEALQKGLKVEWQDQQEEQSQNTEQKDSEMGKYSKQSDLPENPVECLEKEQKFIKSSLKDLVGLFSSFQE